MLTMALAALYSYFHVLSPPMICAGYDSVCSSIQSRNRIISKLMASLGDFYGREWDVVLELEISTNRYACIDIID
jgi:hypothetical protein